MDHDPTVKHDQPHGGSHHASQGWPYFMFWLNMALGLVVMYVVMFSMIDG